MHDITDLIDGYHWFLDTRYAHEGSAYQTLAEQGQAPKIMVIACCDSRVDPSAIFSAGPGELFTVRNVANLVPPFEPHGDYHGTSAALEFAVTDLAVETILVLGHARCGGVRAFLDSLHEGVARPGFIGRWMSLLNPARADALRRAGEDSIEEQQQALEHASIRQSLENLRSFPFVKARLADGTLRLRGAYFDIADGRLQGLDPQTGRFLPVVS